MERTKLDVYLSMAARSDAAHKFAPGPERVERYTERRASNDDLESDTDARYICGSTVIYTTPQESKHDMR